MKNGGVPMSATVMASVLILMLGLCLWLGATGTQAVEQGNGQARLLEDRAACQAEPPAQILPVPQQASFAGGVLPLEGLRLQVVGDAPELQRAVRDLQAELRMRLRLSLPVVEPHSKTYERPGGQGQEPAAPLTLLIGTRAAATLAAKADAAGLTVTRPEGYALHVGEDGVWIVGADPQGAFYGAQTLRQLLHADPPGFRFADIADWPAFPLRMAMIYLDAYSQGINDRLIPILAQYKFNSVLVMSNYVRWGSASNIWHPLGATAAEAGRVAQLIRDHGMEPVPLIELLGHAEWMFYNGQNRDLYQDPDATTPFAYDTLNPRTYQVVKPILDEAIEIFRPRWVHIGHDEVRNVNRFPARPDGRAVGFNKLFYDDVMILYDHLRSRGVGTMMWQDVAFSEATREITRELPKDIVITDWHYNPAQDFPSIREIQESGFRVVGASWYRDDNPETFARSAHKDGALGMLQTRWTGYFGNPSIINGQAEQAIAYLRAAAAFWNPDASAFTATGAAARYYDAWLPATYQSTTGRLVDLHPFVTRSLDDPDGSGWIGKGPEYDFSGLTSRASDCFVRVGPYKFHITGAVMTRANRGIARGLPERVTIPLNASAAALAVLHTTAWSAPASGMPVGRYIMTYEDCSTFVTPLTYQGQIAAWTDPVLKSLLRYPAWRGTTRNGLEVGADVLIIVNPDPSKKIASFTVESSGGSANPAVLGLTLLDAMPPHKEVAP